MPLSRGAIRICKGKFISFLASNAKKEKDQTETEVVRAGGGGGDVKVRPNYKMAERIHQPESFTILKGAISFFLNSMFGER
jgi:hypothetical protein